MEFVKDWIISQVLGEGTYGEVKLLINKQTGDQVAVKMIDFSKDKDISAADIQKEVKKEVAIHRLLNHENIIKFMGSRSSSVREYIFLEYAPNGELFDRIEPERGMPHDEARKYMTQLLNGIDYLHGKGITHRDIKPENLLLNPENNLKISDFGLATVFRSKGTERTLDKKCGTLPYVAPEVLVRPYAAQPADIWSCGIVLVAMLTGELPWDKASDTCASYEAWKSGDYTHLPPWTKLETLPLSLVRRVLAHLPSKRYTSEKIRSHKWFLVRDMLKDDGEIQKMRRSCDQHETDGVVSLSQLPPTTNKLDCEQSLHMFLSQPTYPDDLLLSTQLLNTQTTTAQDCFQKLVRRMTRFIVKHEIEQAMNELTAALSKLNLSYSITAHTVTINTVDRRNTPLVFKSNLWPTDVGTLMDFRLSRGCGLEFKRHFVSIRYFLKGSILNKTD